MLNIERINLSLPAQLNGRANSIARLIAEQLAQNYQTNSINIDHLKIPAMVINPGHSDQQIACHIADQIQSHIDSRYKNGGASC